MLYVYIPIIAQDVALLNMVGASGHMSAELIVQADLEIRRLVATSYQFEVFDMLALWSPAPTLR